MTRIMKLTLTSVLIALLMFGCSDYLDINEDPNNPTEAPIEGLMINTTFETARNTYRVGSTTSFFVQHLASPNEASGTDIHDAISYGTNWSQLYFNIGDLRELIAQAEAIGAPFYTGPAKVMKAYNLSLLVNKFGDVPYSEAFSQDNLQPAYDSSEQVYNVIRTLLTEAISELNASESAASPGSDDFIFGGDIASWRRTAYALQARILNHYSKLPSYDPQAVLSSVDQAFSSNDQDFEKVFFSSPNAAQNQWYRTAVNNAGLLLGGWLSEQTIEHLDGSTYGVFDPRIVLITVPVANADHPNFGEYLGTRNGAGRGADPEQGVRAVLVPGDNFYYAESPTTPLLMSTFAEMKFIEAEAALAANQPTRAYQAYEDGIRAHMEKMGVDPADVDAYWNEPSVSVGEGNLTIDHIMKEKYIAMFLNPEAWNDARRYDYQYQGFQAPANSALGGQMIRLVRYPDSELQRNQANVPDRSMLDRVFWDAN